MAQASPRRSICALTFLLSFFLPGYGQLQGNYTTLSDAFPQLQSLQTPLDKAPGAGGQNFTRCCLQAVSESYAIQDGRVVKGDTGYIGLTPEDLSAKQFPCGAAYNGDSQGAPYVIVPYSWCNQNCGGWQQSSNKVLSQWVQPFVGFILPAAVFCLNVPRRTILAIPDTLFRDYVKMITPQFREFVKQMGIFMKLLGLYKLFRSRFVQNRVGGSERVNTLIQKVRIYSESPATLSVPPEVRSAASVKFHFDKFVSAIAGLLYKSIRISVEAVAMATIAAFIALFGTIIWVVTVFCMAGPMIFSGLYEATLDRKVVQHVQDNSSKKKQKSKDSQHPEQQMGENMRKANPGLYKDTLLLYAVLVGNLTLPPTRSRRNTANSSHQQRKESGSSRNELGDSEKGNVTSRENTVWDDVKFLANQTNKETTRIRLKGMLGCQASFGAAIGAPVVFFLGSFLFSVISNLNAVGDNDTAHALAFGMWWMIIPHVAIVIGCLLAGNNPNTLEVIVCSVISKPSNDDKKSRIPRIRPFYQSFYQPVWMWERGRSKRNWIRVVRREVRELLEPEDFPSFGLNWWNWLILFIILLVLMVVPFVLAFLTSFFTPTVGLGCRSFTFLLYLIFQFLLCAHWLWDFEREPQGEGSASNFYSYCLAIFEASLWFGSAFTAIVGTFLQILGVYRNCLCTVALNFWSTRDGRQIVLSGNSADDIKWANNLWLPTGVTSIVVLIVTCYVGWWYQRHWSSRFRTVIDGLMKSVEEGVRKEITTHVKANAVNRENSGPGLVGPKTAETDVAEADAITPDVPA